MDRAFESQYAVVVAFLLTIIVSGALVAVLLRAALVPQARFTGWVRGITGRNGRYLFLVLLIGWVIAMSALAASGLSANEIGGPAFVGLLIGFFLFMGFIWAVIGD